jgi:hypothetical protein
VLTGNVAHTEAMIKSCKVFVGKRERKKILGRHKRRWEDAVWTDLTKIECESVDRMHVAQYRIQWQALMKMVINHGFHIYISLLA